MPNRQEEFKAVLSWALAPLQAEIATISTRNFIEETVERTAKAIEETYEEEFERKTIKS